MLSGKYEFPLEFVCVHRNPCASMISENTENPENSGFSTQIDKIPLAVGEVFFRFDILDHFGPSRHASCLKVVYNTGASSDTTLRHRPLIDGKYGIPQRVFDKGFQKCMEKRQLRSSCDGNNPPLRRNQSSLNQEVLLFRCVSTFGNGRRGGVLSGFGELNPRSTVSGPKSADSNPRRKPKTQIHSEIKRLR